MRCITLLVALLLAGAAQAQAACFPPPIDTCGRGPVRGVTAGVEWGAWHAERNFDWTLVHWYRLPGAAVVVPPAASAVGLKDYAAALWAANLGGAAVRSCLSPHPEAVPACNALVTAAAATRPPAILYEVDRATAADGTRPGFRLSATGALVSDGTRHRAGAWCECWRGAVKPGAAQYCLITRTTSYAACRRTQG